MGGFDGGSGFSDAPPAGGPEAGGYDPSPPGVSGFGTDSMSGSSGSGSDDFYGGDLNWKP